MKSAVDDRSLRTADARYDTQMFGEEDFLKKMN